MREMTYKEEKIKEFKERLNELIKEYDGLSGKDFKEIFDYYADGTLTIVHKLRSELKPSEVVVKRFYAECHSDHSIWFHKDEKYHGWLASDGQYYVPIRDSFPAGVRIFFKDEEHFKETFKIIEEDGEPTDNKTRD